MRKTLLFFLIFLILPGSALALTGSVDSTNAYAWGENIGWLNFGTAEGDVEVGDSVLTGYGWGENIGWISLNCVNTSSCGTVNYSVSNDGAGNLAGYGWSENTGWISFSCTNTSSCGSVNYGVTIDQGSGDFSGYAWGENIGWLSFNCANTSSCGTVSYKVSIGAAVAAPQTQPGTGGSLVYGGSSGDGPYSYVIPTPSTLSDGTVPAPPSIPIFTPEEAISYFGRPPSELPRYVIPKAPPGTESILSRMPKPLRTVANFVWERELAAWRNVQVAQKTVAGSVRRVLGTLRKFIRTEKQEDQ